MIELEKTYLIKFLPPNLSACQHKEVIDIYIPKSAAHPKTRIRKNGDKFEMTKKEPINESDASQQEEQTIILTEEEFLSLQKIEGKRVSKIRYDYPYNSRIVEVAIFQEGLNGLVLADVEFDNTEEMQNFTMPEFCLADVTQEDFVAGGLLCGKTYAEIEPQLDKYNYKKL